MKYRVYVKETLRVRIEVEAPSEEKALASVRRQMLSGEFNRNQLISGGIKASHAEPIE